ncbi:hypothetical protein [Conchiformibius steedae]|uniref:hypothetical protein n=1 Tax=Conchiformibius steedae TaxID=153493 RepID=UPI0026EFC848|nr:hypothetical protein [Conchiformibius steedae]
MRQDWLRSWRATSYRILFWKFDGLLAILLAALLAIFVFLQLINIVLWWLPFVGVAGVIFFHLLNKRGYDIPNFFRLLGFMLAGRRSRGRKPPKYRF